MVFGKFQKKIWTAIYTIRNEAVRIISVRRARKKEVDLYEN
ncbi:MAG: BrnT family toxin [Candidatus Margulisiibacteriota bacterium]